MFEKTRLKLTGWYLLIIMLISISFSMAMYEILTVELDRVEQYHKLRQERLFITPGFRGLPYEFRQRGTGIFLLDPDLIQETKNRLIASLVLINLGILAASSLAGYFLAGRTLRPIKDMVDEQNRFITDASHELRTPITSLKTEIEVNLRDEKLNEDSKKLLRSNLEEVNTLQTLSDNLIKLTQNQKSNGNVTFEKTSLKEIIDAASKKVAGLAKHKKISINNDIKDEIIFANRESLTEAFVIFLDNAIKYSPKSTSVYLNSEYLDHTVTVSIKDEGPGISEEDLPHIFDRFYRADKSRTKSDVEGFGLGLSIAKQIIERHNGSISVESKEGKGTTFSVKLPLRQT